MKRSPLPKDADQLLALGEAVALKTAIDSFSALIAEALDGSEKVVAATKEVHSDCDNIATSVNWPQ